MYFKIDRSHLEDAQQPQQPHLAADAAGALRGALGRAAPEPLEVKRQNLMIPSSCDRAYMNHQAGGSEDVNSVMGENVSA